MEDLYALYAILGAYIVLVIVITFIVASLLLLWGASIAEVENRSFGKAMLATIAIVLANIISSFIFSAVFRMGTVLNWILAFIVIVFVVQRLLRTDFSEALATVIVAGIAGLILGAISWLVSYSFYGHFATGAFFDMSLVWILTFIVDVLVVRRLFSTTFSKALGAIIFTWIAGLILGVIGWLIMLGYLSGMSYRG